MSNSASALVAPGAIVAGKYRLDAIVGEGGMGSVWSATHTGLGQAVAIKFISKEFVTSPEALRRFDAEAKAAAQLRSRHVVQVYDNGTLEDGTPYIAMELLRGESVYARVHRAGPVPLQEAVEILWQCCKALGRAHAAGIVHRDIKPDNIFLSQSQDDDAPVAKVLDFGIAKFAASPNDHGATRTGAVLGTPLYMSPEQARGLKTIDHRTDLYSLGLVAYTMLTGNLAFSGESFGDLLLQICTAPLPSLRAGAPWLPAGMEGWFARACARDPKDRYATAQDFADGLRAACDGAIRGSALPALAQSTPGTGGVGVGFAQTSVAVAGATTASSATASGMSRSGNTSDVVQVQKSKAPLIAVAAVIGLVLGGVAIAAALSFSKKDHASEPAASGVASAASIPAAASTGPLPTVTLSDPPPASARNADAGGEAHAHGTAQGPSEPPQGAAPAQPLHAAAPHTPPPSPGHPAPHPAEHAPTEHPPQSGAIDLGY
jgi:serine/threonine protein kinase